MITINFSDAISAYLCGALLLVFGLWIFYNYREPHRRLSDDTEKITQCPYCSYVFINQQKSEIFSCPECKSYIMKKDEKST